MYMNTGYLNHSHMDFKNKSRLQFTASSGRHSVLERPFSEANGRPFVS